MFKIAGSMVLIGLLYSGCGSSGCCQGDIVEKGSVVADDKLAPAAVISSERSECVEGGTITFDGRSSSDSDGHVAGYEWLLDGKSAAHNPIATFACEGVGEKRVCLQVKDDDGLSSSYVCQQFAVKPKEVIKAPPTAKIEAPEFCTIGETIQVDGTQSGDSDGEILSYAWSFEEARSSFDKPYFVCAKEGTQQLCLDVTDNDGLHDENCTTIIGQQVPNKPPVARIEASAKSCVVGETVRLDGLGSSDSDGYVAHFNWRPSTADSAKSSFACSAPGLYQVCLSVVDDKGLQSQQVCEEIAVRKPANKAPVAAIVGVPDSCKVGENFVADGTTSSDVDGNVTAWLWSLDDNTTFSDEPKPLFACDKEGTKHICLNVKDNEGALSANPVCKEVTVAPRPPQAIPPVAVITIKPNDGDSTPSVTADCAGSYDPDTIDGDDNPQNDGKILSATFTVSKTYKNGFTEDPHSGSCPKWISTPDNLDSMKISLRVTDDDGQTTVKEEIYDWDGEKFTLRQ